MSFLQELAQQRKKLLEALDANEDDINLDIFEDFYPDQAHFVFELLQNAEDVRATEAVFILSPEGCIFEHNGTPFTEVDVKAITGIHKSPKEKEADQIGRFGVGFKSVFVYTSTPVIHSGGFSFQISRFVLPEPVESDPLVGQKTRFWFPFNSPKKLPGDAYSEVAKALAVLPETTLLFLSHIKIISWTIPKAGTGRIISTQHSEHHFQVSRLNDGKVAATSHLLKFEQAVQGLEHRRTALAFELDFLPNVRRFEPKEPISKQLRIIPARQAQVAVFFPANKETSGLRFHLHAPFVPELSRASVKETPVNLPLFQQVAKLAAVSLSAIRDMGLLTPELLAVLPNPRDEIPLRYQCVRAAIIEAMKTQPLTPTHARSHAPAKHLLAARASLKELLSEKDLELLVEGCEAPPRWSITATPPNSNMNHFLEGLGISEWDVRQFINLLREKASDRERYISSPPYRVIDPPVPEFMTWLSAKPPVWHQKLYALLHTELRSYGGCTQLSGLNIVRLIDGNYEKGSKCFFASKAGENDPILPRVDPRVYTSGQGVAQQENAKKFLEEVGVREVGEAEEIESILKQRYVRGNLQPRKGDLKRFVALVEKDSTKAELFADYFIFERDDKNWGKPQALYLDSPFLDTGLSAYYAALGPDAKRCLVASYLECGTDVKRLVKFAQAVGVQSRLEFTEVSCEANPQKDYLLSSKVHRYRGSRYDLPINRDYIIRGLDELLANPSRELSQLVWRTMSSLPSYPGYLHAIYQPNRSSEAHRAASQVVHQLRNAKWVPQTDGSFVRPTEASRDMLPEGFPFDPGWPWLKAVQFGENITKRSEEQRRKQTIAVEEEHRRQAVATQLGFGDQASLERARRFAAFSPEEQERILAEHGFPDSSELPERIPRDPERRAERVSARAATAPERRTEQRMRSISVGREEVKKETEQYLRAQYTNGDGEMICQVCKGPLPFKLDDDSYYFEMVEFLQDLKNRHYQNYLALCPNHSAMYQYTLGCSIELMRDQLVDLAGNELDVVLARKDATIYFTKTHIADLKAVIATDALGPFDHHIEPDQADSLDDADVH